MHAWLPSCVRVSSVLIILRGAYHGAYTGNNEIDRPLLDLLQQNIDAAKSAGQAEPAAFMEKVRDAARKFVLT
jgi:hypothetical protein